MFGLGFQPLQPSPNPTPYNIRMHRPRTLTCLKSSALSLMKRWRQQRLLPLLTLNLWLAKVVAMNLPARLQSVEDYVGLPNAYQHAQVRSAILFKGANSKHPCPRISRLTKMFYYLCCSTTTPGPLLLPSPKLQNKSHFCGAGEPGRIIAMFTVPLANLRASSSRQQYYLQ